MATRSTSSALKASASTKSKSKKAGKPAAATAKATAAKAPANQKARGNGKAAAATATPTANPGKPAAKRYGPSWDQIAERAYFIWQAKGCPSGLDEENWREAEAQCELLYQAQRRHSQR